MDITFWGTRGSIAKAGPGTVRFGGNTSCVEVRSARGTLVVLDCGTGAHGLGQHLIATAMGARIDGHILIGHTHWDHIQGLPFFAPLFQAGNEWHIYAPRGLGTSVSQTLAGQMQYTYFPVTLEQLSASIGYHDLVEGTFDVEDIRITTQYLNHPALTLGYRLEADGVTVVYATDHEPHDRASTARGEVSRGDDDTRHVAFLRNADLVIHDAQYLTEEYPAKVGWGHSTVEYAVGAAGIGGARRLALFHHDPTRDDASVDALVTRAKALAVDSGYRTEVFAAAEGLTVGLGLGAAPVVEHAARATAHDIPALEQLSRAVLIAVRDPAIATVLCGAVKAEGLEVLEASERTSALALALSAQPAIIIIEHDPVDGDVLRLNRAMLDLDTPCGGDVGVVAITRGGPRGETEATLAITDWLVWPSSEVYVRTRLRAWLLRRACCWENAPLPPDEDRRVRSLRDLRILDTQPEERFDRYTKLASSVFNVPVAILNLVDVDRQWFKSRHGVDSIETPRDMSMCAHAILGDDVFQVPDAFEDPRFADNPLVCDVPRIRFYAGVPLTLSDGSRIGTLCLIDHRPRMLDDSQLAELRRLGRLVEKELESTAPG